MFPLKCLCSVAYCCPFSCINLDHPVPQWSSLKITSKFYLLSSFMALVIRQPNNTVFFNFQPRLTISFTATGRCRSTSSASMTRPLPTPSGPPRWSRTGPRPTFARAPPFKASAATKKHFRHFTNASPLKRRRRRSRWLFRRKISFEKLRDSFLDQSDQKWWVMAKFGFKSRALVPLPRSYVFDY